MGAAVYIKFIFIILRSSPRVLTRLSMAQLQTLEFKQAFEEFDKVPLVHTYVQPSSSFSKRYFTDIEIHL